MKKLFLLLLLLAGMSQAQTTVAPFLNSEIQLLDNSGSVCSGCLLDTFAAGTTTPLVTYSESTGTTPNANPIVLSSAGRATVYLTSASYKFRLRSAAGVTLWTQDQITWATPLSTFAGISDAGNFTQTQPTAATNIANQSSFNDCMTGNYWTGSVSAADQWCLQDALGTGTNPTSTFTLTHSGSSGASSFSVAQNTSFGGNVTIAGTESSQIDNQVFQANKYATGGAGTSGSPWTSASGTGGIQEAINAAGTAFGGFARIHIPAGYYNITTCVNATANLSTVFGTSSPPSPLIIEGDGMVKTILVGNTGGCVIDQTGRVARIAELAITQGSSSKSTVGILQGRAANTESQFSFGNVIEHVFIELPTVPAANGGNGTVGIYNYTSEDNHYRNNQVAADHPYVLTSNNIFSITSSFVTQLTTVRNVTGNMIESGSCNAEGVVTGECILLQGHVSNTVIRAIPTECGGATPSPVAIRIKAATAPDSSTDPINDLNVQNIAAECPGGQMIVNEALLMSPHIYGSVSNLAAVPVILMNASTASLLNPEINVVMGNAGVTTPLISDAGASTGGITGGTVYLPATATIALTNATSTCFGVSFHASYSSPSVVCANVANQVLNGIVSSLNGWSMLNSGGANYGSDTSHTFKVQGATAFTLNPSYAIFGKPTSLTETTAPSGLAGGDVCYGDSTAHAMECSYNNDAFKAQTRTIASGTAAMTTALIAAGACGSTVTVAGTGILTTDVVDFARNAAATSGNGGILTLNAWPTAGNANFNYCNPTAAGVTPTAATINWTVTR